MLEVIVGLLFTYLLLSLLGTTLNELISSWLGWRGNYLDEGLKRLLEYKDNPKVYESFKSNPFYRQLKQHDLFFRKSKAPDYLSSSNFVSILIHSLNGLGGPGQKSGSAPDNIQESISDIIADMPEGTLKKVLEQFSPENRENLKAYKAQLEVWFNTVMEQASGWYKRHLQIFTLFIGLLIAGVFNADSFQIYHHLATNSIARQMLASMAASYVGEHNTLPTYEANWKGVKEVISDSQFSETVNILGLGWQGVGDEPDLKKWPRRIVGWFITSLAISMGAPFWFDLLKKLISLRGESEPTQVVVNTAKE